MVPPVGQQTVCLTAVCWPGWRVPAPFGKLAFTTISLFSTPKRAENLTHLSPAVRLHGDRASSNSSYFRVLGINLRLRFVR